MAKNCPQYVRKEIIQGRNFVTHLDNPHRRVEVIQKIRIWKVVKRIMIGDYEVIDVEVWDGHPLFENAKVIRRFQIDTAF